MFKYNCLNPIASVGLDLFSGDYEKVEDLGQADAALVRSAAMHELELPDSLLAVARAGAGVNNIPLDKCAEKGIVVFNTPGANANGVKELVFAGMLYASRDIVGGIDWCLANQNDENIAKTAEKQKKNFAGTEISGKKLGVIGLGAIGVLVANAAIHMGMDVYGYDPYISVSAAWNLSRSVKHISNVEDIYRECDYITIHVPLLDSTKKMVNAEAIAMMKPNAIVLNFARDLLVDEEAMVEALAAGKIKKYVSDFPNPTTVGAKGCIVTPHLGASTAESEDNCAIMAVREIRDYMENGNIVHSVNFPDCSMGACTTAGRIGILHRNVSGMISQYSTTLGDAGMNIYSKNGDKGTTNLVHTKNVSKSDDRVRLFGDLDELNSYLGLVKTMIDETDTIRMLEKVQMTLLMIMDGVADPFNREYKVDDDKTELLEEEISRLEELFPHSMEMRLPGQCRLSAEIDVARTVARRAERALAAVSVKFGADNGAKKYMNRLADYLYTLARYADAKNSGKASAVVEKPAEIAVHGGKDEVRTMKTNQTGTVNETVIQEVLRKMGIQGRISLDSAKRLIEKIEQEAERRGKKAVIAVCGPDGNPIAVHVMDGAFLVSFDVATKKAYTSVAVKMSTQELSVLAQPGGTFYGVDKMDNGKIVIFGGGVPLKVGDTIIGGLGISGGTGEEDHSLAEYGLSVLNEVL